MTKCLDRVFVLVLTLILAGCFGSDNTVRLQLDTIDVVKSRQNTGDHPYFGVVSFRSQFGVENSTQVDLRSFIPRNWVSLPQYSNQSQLMSGDSASIPWWMGQHEWRGFRWVPFAELQEGKLPEVVGALVLAFDHNRTPAEAVEGMMAGFSSVLKGVLLSQVEHPQWLNTGAQPANFFSNLLKTLTKEIQLKQSLGYFYQFTMGSGFRPDQLAGMELFIVPGVPGLRAPVSSSVVIPGLFNASITLKLTLLPMTPAELSTRYRGAGAVYDVSSKVVLGDTDRSDETFAALMLDVKNGAVTMPEGGNLQVDVGYCRGGRYEQRRFENITESRSLTPHSDTRITLPFTGVPAKDVSSIVLNWIPPAGKQVSPWNLQALRVGYLNRYSESTYFVRHGRPLHRFGTQSPRWRFQFAVPEGCE